jgi:hypothetical protein
MMIEGQGVARKQDMVTPNMKVIELGLKLPQLQP